MGAVRRVLRKEDLGASGHPACFAQPFSVNSVYLLDRCRGPERRFCPSKRDSTNTRQGVPKNSRPAERVWFSVSPGGRRVMRYAAIGFCLLTLIGCKREARDVRPSPAISGTLGDAAAESVLNPGGVMAREDIRNPY